MKALEEKSNVHDKYLKNQDIINKKLSLDLTKL